MSSLPEVPIIYQDDDLLVVDKPAGLLTHGVGRANEEVSLADCLLAHFPSLAEVGEPEILTTGVKVSKSGLVHRLDKDTSGVLLVAKNQRSFQFLKQAFIAHQVTKTYWALVHGQMKITQDHAWREIVLPIGRSRRDPRRRVASPKAKGVKRSALTRYRPIAVNDQYSLVEAEPYTGRTHQIRVHFKALNYPIVGDNLYAPEQAIPFGLNRQFLHAKKIDFPHPQGGRLQIEAPLPAELKLLLDKIGLAC